MQPELIPRALDGEDRAVAAALDVADLDLEPRDDAYGSAWRAAGLREGVARASGDATAFSPEPSLL